MFSCSIDNELLIYLPILDTDRTLYLKIYIIYDLNSIENWAIKTNFWKSNP